MNAQAHPFLGFAAIGAGAFALLTSWAHRDKLVQRFNKLAEGLTAKERAVAQRFWDAGRELRRGELAEHAANKAALLHVEAARVALDRLEKSLALVNSPDCHPQVARWLVKHWLLEVGETISGKPSPATRALAREEMDPAIAQVVKEILEQVE